MAVGRYKKTGRVKLSEHFSSNEFACRGKGCCSSVQVSRELVLRLEQLRTELGRPITITSGYRCEKRNKEVGGASASYHMRGMAADIVVRGVSIDDVAEAAEKCGFKGIIKYSAQSFVHVDVRSAKYFAKNNGTRVTRVTSFGGRVCPYEMPVLVRQGDKGSGVRYVQWCLVQLGYKLTIDGDFGPLTRAAVKTFQANCGLVTDGIAGEKTLERLRAAV